MKPTFEMCAHWREAGLEKQDEEKEGAGQENRNVSQRKKKATLFERYLAGKELPVKEMMRRGDHLKGQTGGIWRRESVVWTLQCSG